jgi:Fungal protein kinase
MELWNSKLCELKIFEEVASIACGGVGSAIQPLCSRFVTTMAPSESLPNSSEVSQPAYYTSSEIARRPLDTKWLEGSENTVKTTVVELKRLLNMELHNSIECNESLAKAVFPDHNLPIQINDDLLNGPRVTRRQTRRSPKSVLSQPPEDWSEANTCQWLNDIGETLRQANVDANYTNNDGQVVTPSKRIWSSAYSSIYMKQQKNKQPAVPRHKPDIILIDHDFDGDISWPQVHTLVKVTRTELIKSWTIKDRVYQKSYVMFRSQDNRNFVPSLYFTGEGFFTFNVCDHSGIVYTTTLEIADHPLILLRILAGLMFGRPSVVGYDETVQCDSCGRAVLIRVGGLDYRVIAALFKSTALCGRATRCWNVESMDGCKEGFVLKDCWADIRREQSEILILELIRELGLCESYCVPRLVHGENVPVLLNVELKLYGDDCTGRRRGKDSKVEGRVHRQLLMKPLGRHLTDFRCLHELVGAAIDAVEGPSFC